MSYHPEDVKSMAREIVISYANVEDDETFRYICKQALKSALIFYTTIESVDLAEMHAMIDKQ